MKKISVIIPVYNVESYLEECVDSVLAQTYKAFEILLIDDGSTDSSGDICDRYASENASVRVIHKENGGLSSARNCGLDNASGDCVLFLDSDDYLVETALEDAICIIEKEKCDFVFFDALSFNDKDRDYGIKQNYIRKNDYNLADGLSILVQQLKNKEYHSQVCLMLFLREFLEINNLRFYDGILYEDMLFTFQAYCISKKVVQLRKVLYHRRYRSGSIVMSKVTVKNFKSNKKVFEEACLFSDNYSILTNEAVKLYLAKCAYNTMNIYKRMEKIAQKEEKESYISVKTLCKKYNYFDDTALEMRCKGKVFWFIYKVFTKLFRVK